MEEKKKDSSNFVNIIVALTDNGIGYDDYCKFIGISNRSFRYRLTGEREFTLKEMEKTSELLPGRTWEELFKR